MELENSQAPFIQNEEQLNHLNDEHLCFSYTVMTLEMYQI